MSIDPFALIESGDVAGLTRLLAARPELRDARTDTAYQKRLTLLHVAAGRGDVAMVEALLAAGLDPATPNGSGSLPVTAAIWDGHEAVVERLLSPLPTTGDGAYYVLTTAATNGHLGIVRRALDHGIAVDLDDGRGNTALSRARSAGHRAIVALLLERGAAAPAEAEHEAEDDPEEYVFPDPGPVEERLPGARRIKVAEARRLLERHGARPSPRERFYLYEGDARIRGNLILHDHEVVIATGDVSVGGALVDHYYNYDDCSRVFVRGDLAVKHLVTGSPIHVGADLRVRGLLYANSEEEYGLEVVGKLKVGTLIDDRHGMTYAGLEAGRILARRELLDLYEGEASPIEAAVFASPDTYARGVVSQEAVYRAAVEDRPLLKP